MKKKHSLLIVDDEPNVLKSLNRLLIGSDYEVLTGESGEEGFEILERHEVHLVISDFRMPSINGVEFLSKVREKYPETIRMVISGYADVESIVGAINNGHVYKFIAKPWNDQELLTTILRAFEQYDLQAENQDLYDELKKNNEELQQLTKSLEGKVIERTRDLELKNRALEVSQRILNQLPVGVLGVDSEGVVVYMNRSLGRFISTRGLSLGLSVPRAIDDELFEALMSAIVEQRIVYHKFDEDIPKEFVCTPLPDKAGAIGVFYFRNPDESPDGFIKAQKSKGALNA